MAEGYCFLPEEAATSWKWFLLMNSRGIFMRKKKKSHFSLKDFVWFLKIVASWGPGVKYWELGDKTWWCHLGQPFLSKSHLLLTLNPYLLGFYVFVSPHPQVFIFRFKHYSALLIILGLISIPGHSSILGYLRRHYWVDLWLLGCLMTTSYVTWEFAYLLSTKDVQESSCLQGWERESRGNVAI